MVLQIIVWFYFPTKKKELVLSCIVSVTCFNSVINYCWYYIITSVTCFNSVINFCWYYIITSVTCFNSVTLLCLIVGGGGIKSWGGRNFKL